MKQFNIILVLICILLMSFFALKKISDTNIYTGVREYTKPKVDSTPPIIEFVKLKDGDIIYENAIYVEVNVQDDTTPPESILVEGDGGRYLHSGFNPIVVSARDTAGNVSSQFIIIEKR